MEFRRHLAGFEPEPGFLPGTPCYHWLRRRRERRIKRGWVLRLRPPPWRGSYRLRGTVARAITMFALLAGWCLSAAPANAQCAPDPASSGQTVTCDGTVSTGFH